MVIPIPTPSLRQQGALFLDPSYSWSHVVHGLLNLASFTERGLSCLHVRVRIGAVFLLSVEMDPVLRIIHVGPLVTCLWTSEFFPLLG